MEKKDNEKKLIKNIAEIKKQVESGEKKVAKSGSIKVAGYTSRKAQMVKGSVKKNEDKNS